jgi:hypothetical protein
MERGHPCPHEREARTTLACCARFCGPGVPADRQDYLCTRSSVVTSTGAPVDALILITEGCGAV